MWYLIRLASEFATCVCLCVYALSDSVSVCVCVALECVIQFAYSAHSRFGLACWMRCSTMIWSLRRRV